VYVLSFAWLRRHDPPCLTYSNPPPLRAIHAPQLFIAPPLPPYCHFTTFTHATVCLLSALYNGDLFRVTPSLCIYVHPALYGRPPHTDGAGTPLLHSPTCHHLSPSPSSASHPLLSSASPPPFLFPVLFLYFLPLCPFFLPSNPLPSICLPPPSALYLLPPPPSTCHPHPPALTTVITDHPRHAFVAEVAPASHQ